MRAVRLVAAVVAFALLALTPLALSAPVEAAGAAPSVATTAPSKELKVTARIIKSHGKLYIKGFVHDATGRPQFGKIVISSARVCNKQTGTCQFHRYKKVGLKKGHYMVKVIAPKKGNLYWQSHVGKYKSDIWVTCKTTTGSCSGK